MEARMKRLALTTLLTLAIGAYTPARSQGPYDRRADAHKDIQAALTEAQADGKLVLLDFGANWCLDCIVLSHLYEDETVHPFLDANFHVVNIDVGNWDKNLDVSQRYGSPIDGGIPALVILAGSGEMVASTKNGALAAARTANARAELGYLKRCVDHQTIGRQVAALGLTFPVYPEGAVTLRLPVILTPKDSATAVLSVTYMACSDRICLAPVIDKRIAVRIPALAASAP